MPRLNGSFFTHLIIVFILIAGAIALTSSLSDENSEQSTARILAGELTVIIEDPEGKILLNTTAGPDSYKVARSNATVYTYTVVISGSNYSTSNLTIVWEIDTGTDVLQKTGANITYAYYQPGEYWINVEVDDLDGKNGSARLQVTVKIDLEGDGLPDWWELGYFGDIKTADESSNYDDDPYTDLEEYQMGTDPTVANFPEEKSFIESYWWALAAVAIIVALLLIFMLVFRPKMRQRRSEEEQRKIAAAIEIERALERETEEEKR